MNPLNRAFAWALIASVLAVSGCVVAPDHGHGDEHADAVHGPDTHCDSNDEHRSADCQDAHH